MTKMKKLVVAAAVLAASTQLACAANAPYFGLGTGLDVNTAQTGNYRAMPLNLFAGYGGSNQVGYLAGEIFVTPGVATVSSDGTQTRTTYSYGASVIPGVMLADHTLGFARLGVVRTHFKSQDSTVNGGQLGLGMQTGLTQDWDVRGEYTFTAYNSVGGVTSPKSDQFNLSFVYKMA